MKSSLIAPLFWMLCACFFCGCKTESGDSAPGENLFTLLPSDETGINFENTLTEGLNTNILMYEYFYNGGGVASGDFNGDGLVDLYFTSNMGDNKFYLNKGDLKFQDITIESMAGGRPGPWKTGVNAVDINADGRLDIYLCYSGALPPAKRANQLFINTGNDSRGIPMFEDRAEAYGLASTGFSNQSYFFDYDCDGDLDMLLLNHNPKNLPILNEVSTAQLFQVDNPEKGLRLFRQEKGRFEDVTVSSGINGSELSYGLGLGISDLDGDGWPDFYVSNDYAVPDYLYINNRNGTFTNRVEKSLGHTSQFSMGNDIADVNNDLLPDIYTLDMLPEDNRRQKLLLAPDNYEKFNQNLRNGFYYQYMRNMLQLNNGNGSFSETGQLAGVSNTDWSWSALLADYDNDGWKDLHVTNGYLRDYTNLDFINYMNDYVQEKGRLEREDVMDIIKEMPSSNVKNYFFRNREGVGFENKSREWGISQASNSNGAAYADLDNDGDLDLVVNNINQPAFVYRNESRPTGGNHFLQVKLAGLAGNTMGLGARLTLFHKGNSQVQEQYPARGYLSSVSSVLHFGLGAAQQVDSLQIRWNNGRQQRLYGIKADQVITLSEKDAVAVESAPVAIVPWFAESGSGVNYVSPDTIINDYNRQLLLISQFSYNGPVMASADLNRDGLEDIVVGGEAGHPTALFLQQPGGTFMPKKPALFEQDKAFHDAGLAVFDANGDGYADIYAASGGYHNLAENDALLQDRLYLGNGKGDFVRSGGLPAITGSKSCVEVMDINGDGAADLFVGGRVVPGRYPESPRSYILVNDGKGNFSDQATAICGELVKPGMVTDAVWTDLDMDKVNELVVVGEWMPVTVFKKVNGKLVNSTDKFFSRPQSGFWNTVTAGDFNRDGRTDLVIGNMGLNTQFSVTDEEPAEMFYADFDKNGSVDPIFSFFIGHRKYPYVTRDEMVMQLPYTRKRFSNFSSYADVTMDELFKGDELKTAARLAANHMATTLYMGGADGKLTEKPLPREVQYSPVYSILQLDFNSDGHTDLLLTGNNSRMKIRLGKFDANYGLLLAGDGKGNFRALPQTKSGFNIRGDVRSGVFIGDKVYLGVNGKGVISYSLQKKEK